jgi:hypothetical protein
MIRSRRIWPNIGGNLEFGLRLIRVFWEGVMSSTTTVTRTKTSAPVKRFPSSTPSKVRTRAQRRLNPSPAKRQQPPPLTTPQIPPAVLQPSNRLPFVPFTFTPHRETISMPPKPPAKRKNTKTQKAIDSTQTTLTFPNASAAVRKRSSSPGLDTNEGPSPKRLRTDVCPPKWILYRQMLTICRVSILL